MGIIYKIQIGDLIYYGSTIQLLSRRQARHNHNLKHNPIQLIYKECIEQNISKIICEIVEICNNNQIKERENFYIKNCNNSLNMRDALLTEQRKKETNKKYYQSEKGKLNKRNCDRRYREKLKINQH
jgi:hypothetical protein